MHLLCSLTCALHFHALAYCPPWRHHLLPIILPQSFDESQPYTSLLHLLFSLNFYIITHLPTLLWWITSVSFSVAMHVDTATACSCCSVYVVLIYSFVFKFSVFSLPTWLDCLPALFDGTSSSSCFSACFKFSVLLFHSLAPPPVTASRTVFCGMSDYYTRTAIIITTTTSYSRLFYFAV